MIFSPIVSVRRLVRILGVTLVAVSMFGLSPALEALRGQQTKMPRPSGDRPLDDRIAGFERQERVDKLKPDEVIKALDVKDGMVIADIGAGTGLFSRRFAKAVAPHGKVYAVDISADIMEYLRDRAKKENLTNLEVIVSKPDDPLLPPRSIDLVFFSDTTHHIDHRVAFYQTMIKGLKDHARVAIIDYPPDAKAKGWCSHEPNELVPESQVKDELAQVGFKFVKSVPILPQNYFLIFERDSNAPR